MQIKNVINDNDYEFTMSSLSASFVSISSLSSTGSNYSLNSSSSSSIKDSNSPNVHHHHHHHHHNQQPNHQQDILKICVLLFDTYQKISKNNENKQVHISRQSIQESLLPGLNCLKDIFLNNVISTNNEYVQQLDQLIHKMEQTQQNYHHAEPSSSQSSLLQVSNDSSSFQKSVTPLKVANSVNTAVVDLVNVGVSVLANTSSNSIADNANFKSFVFKGISNFKDHSKDKFNFLMTNKNAKK